MFAISVADPDTPIGQRLRGPNARMGSDFMDVLSEWLALSPYTICTIVHSVLQIHVA
jgi:hypothetical protein